MHWGQTGEIWYEEITNMWMQDTSPCINMVMAQNYALRERERDDKVEGRTGEVMCGIY